MANTSITVFDQESEQIASILKTLTVTNHDEYKYAAEILVDVKSTLKQIDEEKKKVTKPQREALKATTALFDKIALKYQAMEKGLREDLTRFLDAEKAKETKLLQAVASGEKEVTALELIGDAAPTADGVSSRSIKTWTVEDESLIPQEYFVLDAGAIGAAVRKGAVIPGIKVGYKTSLAVST